LTDPSKGGSDLRRRCSSEYSGLSCSGSGSFTFGGWCSIWRQSSVTRQHSKAAREPEKLNLLTNQRQLRPRATMTACSSLQPRSCSQS
jgi:hypothetical protein